MDDDYDREPAPDPAQEAVEDGLRELFEDKPQEVFYGRQLVVRFESQYFHWITNRALRHLAAAGEIQTDTKPLWSDVHVKFYFSTECRYWRRRADAMLAPIRRYSVEDFGRALGHQGETMFDAALGGRGFRVLGKNVDTFEGKEWKGSGENLGRIYGRDGLRYGSEIKNTLDYIPRDELQAKLEACEVLGVTPLFIMRMAPKTYMHEIINAGGYGLLFGHQMYPFGQDGFAKEVRAAMGLPVACPAAVADGILDKFESWHKNHVAA